MRSKRTAFKISGIFLMLFLVLALVTPAMAFEPMGGDRVVIEEGEVIDDDLYVGASTFILNGTIKGDLLAVGQTIVIGPKGVVEDDFWACAQSVVINGSVGDDARIAGAVLTLGNSAQVGGDLISAGFTMEAESGSSIGKDAVVTGMQAVISGDVDRNLLASVAGLQLNGSVGGDVDAEVGSPADMPPFSPLTFMPLDPEVPIPPTIKGGLTIGQDAEIGGDLTYTAESDAAIPSGAVSGNVQRDEPPQTEVVQAPPPTTGEKALSWFFKLLRRLITLFVIGSLLMWLLPDMIRKSVRTLQQKPLHSLLWGFLSYFLFFFLVFLLIVVVILLAILLGTLTLGALVLTTLGAGLVLVSSLLLTFQLAFAYVAKIVIAYLIGRWILMSIHKESAENRFWPVLLGVFLLVCAVAVVELIPVLGGLLVFLMTLFGLGALVMIGYDCLRKPPTLAETQVTEELLETGAESEIIVDEPGTEI